MAPGEVMRVNPGDAVDRRRVITVGPAGDAERPFDARQLEMLDEVIDAAERVTGLRFSAYLGDLGADSRSSALSLLRRLGADGPNAVLLAVSPAQRTVEVVTGSVAALRITDRAARLAVLNVVSSVGNGDLHGALMNGIRTLADQAGMLPERSGW